MTSPVPDERTPAELIASWVPADTLINRLQRQLTAAGSRWEDLDQHLAKELGITFDQWVGYLDVLRATDRYQTSRWPTSPTQPDHQIPSPHPLPDPINQGLSMIASGEVHRSSATASPELRASEYRRQSP